MKYAEIKNMEYLQNMSALIANVIIINRHKNYKI